jgi:hypothetical protein
MVWNWIKLMTLKLGNWLLLHAALLILQVAYPEAFCRTTVNDSAYTPKVHRKMWHWLKPMTTWIHHKAGDKSSKIGQQAEPDLGESPKPDAGPVTTNHAPDTNTTRVEHWHLPLW